MKESEEREGNPSESHKGVQSPRVRNSFSTLSFSRIDKRDLEILSLARDSPATLLTLSERMGISFVECLHRARRLLELGLLKRVDSVPGPEGLYLYLATRQPSPFRSIAQHPSRTELEW